MYIKYIQEVELQEISTYSVTTKQDFEYKTNTDVKFSDKWLEINMYTLATANVKYWKSNYMAFNVIKKNNRKYN